ncbi:Elongin-C [Cryptotermes secundus]|uniref:Elongin-C n=2 Tax=Cryptotermes secundus TaxID=105785 RepID=A0A2J7QHA9_9NEOP|nr:Elongin-C [Cryptotermes secundus]
MGPGAMYVTITSADGHEFIIKRKYAEASETFEAMIGGPSETPENEPLRVDMKRYQSHVLQTVCTYLIYKVYYTNSTTEIPLFPIASEMSLELVDVANYLNC